MATFVCPACWKVTEVPDDMAGRRVRCPDCHAIGPTQPLASPPAPPAPAPKLESGPEPVAVSRPPPAPVVRETAARAPLPEIRRPPTDTRRVVVVVAWSACLVWTLGVMLKYGWLMDKADSVVQQTALGVRACAWILGGYVVARAVHAIVRVREKD
jgi:hypothetical protein